MSSIVKNDSLKYSLESDVTDNVTDRQNLILDIINTNSNISISKLADNLKVSKRTVLRDLDKLINKKD